MPLENAAAGTPGFSRNVATEVKAGKDVKQAVAIAYAKAGKRGDGAAARLDALFCAADGLYSRSDALQTGRWDQGPADDHLRVWAKTGHGQLKPTDRISASGPEKWDIHGDAPRKDAEG